MTQSTPRPPYSLLLGIALFWTKVVFPKLEMTLVNSFGPTAHVIRNRSTAIAQACFALQASRRWAMTGTPIQNKPADLGSLLEFMHLQPFADPKIFDAIVVKPWLKSCDRDTAPLKKLIKYISLCRTKAIIDLPPRQDLIHYIDLSPEEQDLYEAAKNRTVQRLDEALSYNPIASGMYLNALEWLNELRLICNHGLMHAKKETQQSTSKGPSSGPWNKSIAKKAFATLVDGGSAICKLCQANLAAGTGEADGFDHSKPSLSKCLTVICGSCIQNRLDGEKVPGCGCVPVCPKAEVSWAPEIPDKQPGTGLPKIEDKKVPTKLKTLSNDLQEHSASEKRHETLRSSSITLTNSGIIASSSPFGHIPLTSSNQYSAQQVFYL
jgi:SWI/SNF-related matrix-associated actin-dependent regulator of chromatin subfamily A3